MTEKHKDSILVDRWTGMQARAQEDDCHCVHAAEALLAATVAPDPAVERLAEIIAQRG